MHAKTPSERLGDRRRLRIERERALAELAERQHGVVTKRQLEDHGVGRGAIANRVDLSHLYRVHRGVYAVGRPRLTRYGRWMAAVLAYGDRALLSHRGAGALWGLVGVGRGRIDVNCPGGKSGRPGIALHQANVYGDERAINARIPVTSVSRTLVDLAGIVNETQLARACEEADRLRLLDMNALAKSCDRAKRRRGIPHLRRFVEEARAPAYPRTPLENRFLEFYRAHLSDLPPPATNVLLLGHEVDGLWPKHRVAVEMDSWEFHRHRAAFEEDRARDAARQAAGYRVVRLTHRRLKCEPAAVARELRALLTAAR